MKLPMGEQSSAVVLDRTSLLPTKQTITLGPGGTITLEFKDGAPSPETMQKVYDHLDFTHAFNAFMNTMQGVSIEALHQGFQGAGVKDNERIVAIVNVGEPAEIPAPKKREPAAAFTVWRP